MAIRAGGDFYYTIDNTDKHSGDLLLLAGGVGINPLYSILQHFQHLHSSHESPNHGCIPKATFMYSARNTDELIFKVSFAVFYVAFLISSITKFFLSSP